MRILTGLTAQPIQTVRASLDTGERVKLTFSFRPAVGMWFLDIEYRSRRWRGLRMNNNLNLLRQWKNVIPFGIAIFAPEFTEPLLINDLSTRRVRIGILTKAEVATLEQAYEDANA